jgi:AcrR family transcriptional regulator
MVAVPNRDRRAERREATRQEILAAAWEVARETSLAGLTLREVAARVGMQPPSLYSHFASKSAIYDAMFEQGWRAFNEHVSEVRAAFPTHPRERLLVIMQTFFDFAVADVARHQLMNIRSLADFEPSHGAYAAAVEVYERGREDLAAIGVCEDADLDVLTALISGLANQQLANDLGGDRWRLLLPRVADMFADELGLPSRPTRGRKR